MQLLAFFAIVGLAYPAQGLRTVDPLPPQPWANEAKYGPYQDAWKSVNQNDTTKYWLVMATFNDDGASWGREFQCLSVQEKNRIETNKSVVSVFTFQNATGNYTVEEQVQAIFQYNYSTTENAIQYTLKNGTKLNDTLIFSDNRCDIFHVPHMNNGNGCELWVKEEYINNVPSSCLFIYKFFCVNVTSYEIYNENCTKIQVPK
uniref:Lipocal-1 1 n=1 Tax=Amblyomma americanum TaxID=6943 RepID=A0A0C9R682_AMBAM